MTQKRYVQISIPQEVLDEIDSNREESLLTRSAWFLKAAKAYLEGNSTSKPRKRIDL